MSHWQVIFVMEVTAMEDMRQFLKSTAVENTYHNGQDLCEDAMTGGRAVQFVHAPGLKGVGVVGRVCHCTFFGHGSAL